MPRLGFVSRVPRPWVLAAAAVALGAAPGETLHAALASAAGTLFESLPFVLAGALLPRGRLDALLGLAGCGCRGAPGNAALSLPAFGLCWLAFGPAAAIARVGLGLAVEAARRRAAARSGVGSITRETPDPATLDDRRREIAGRLHGIALAALAGALLSELVRSRLGAVPAVGALAGSGALAVVSAFAAGAFAGALAPCATAGVAFASSVRSIDAALAFGALATSGIVGLPRLHEHRHDAEAADPRFALLLVSAAAAALVAGGDRGFVNTRLIAPIALGGLVMAALAVLPGAGRERTRPAPNRRSAGLLAPATLGLALVLGSPPPGGPVLSALDAAAPGDAFATTGVVRDGGRAIVRAAITCCRADARLVGVTLAATDRHRDGTWVSARGVIVLRRGTPVLAIDAERAIPEPRDPFSYW